MVTVELRRWADGDLWLLKQANEPSMTRHLGGPESDADVEKRHANYLRFWREGGARVYRVDADGEPAGSIGWWDSEWEDEPVHETGWFTLPWAQGRGVASRAVELVIEDVRRHGRHDLLTAFPSVENGPSNALCARTGFRLRTTADLPFRGTVLKTNVWVLDLSEAGGGARRGPRTPRGDG